MKTSKQILGNIGENITCSVLKKEGYHILERNYKTTFGEIDIIAKRKHTISFIEVKSRTDASLYKAKDALKEDQMKRIVNCSKEYIQNILHKKGINTEELEFTYDVAAIQFDNNGNVLDFQYFNNYLKVIHYEDLCRPTLRYDDRNVPTEDTEFSVNPPD